jgi:hypothetical protein
MTVFYTHIKEKESMVNVKVICALFLSMFLLILEPSDKRKPFKNKKYKDEKPSISFTFIAVAIQLL